MGLLSDIVSVPGKLVGGVLGGLAEGISPTPQMREVSKKTKKAAARQVDAKALEEQYKQNALLASQQQLAQTNALMASQKGINPALATMQMGNLQSQAAQGLAASSASEIANLDYDTRLKNIGLSQNLYSLEQGGNIAQMQGAVAARGQTLNLMGAIAGGVGSAISLIASDERLKEPPHERIASAFFKHHAGEDASEDFHSLFDGVEGYSSREKLPSIGTDSKDMKNFLNSLNPVEFSYKGGSVADDGGKTHAGVLAQDVEKTKLGKDIVVNQDGYKALDIPSLVSNLTAGIGYLNEKINKLEGRKNG